MQRYKEITDVKKGHRVTLNNTLGIIKELPKINLVCTVIGTEEENVIIEFDTYEKGLTNYKIPYFLLQ